MKSPALSAVNAQCVSVASAAVAPHAKFEDGKRGVKCAAEKFSNASQGTAVSRGPLHFAYPIPAERTEDTEEHANMNGKKSASPEFKSWNLRPAGPFNYALASRRAEVIGDGEAGDGFFKNPGAIKLRVSVRRIDWPLDENRYTPDIPERPVIIGDALETIELVPYGATMLRLSVFPDVSKETFTATVWRGETAYVDIPAGVRSRNRPLRVGATLGEATEPSGASAEGSGVSSQGSGVSDRMAEIAKRYHFFQSVRDQSFDFGGFRREVESLVNDSASPSER